MFLENIVAPAGSDKTAQLISAAARWAGLFHMFHAALKIARLPSPACAFAALSYAAALPSCRGADSGQLYYVMEFTVESPTFQRHNLAVYGARNDLLYTLNCQCPEQRWAAEEAAFRCAASTFQILSSGSGAAGYPERL